MRKASSLGETASPVEARGELPQSQLPLEAPKGSPFSRSSSFHQFLHHLHISIPLFLLPSLGDRFFLVGLLLLHPAVFEGIFVSSNGPLDCIKRGSAGSSAGVPAPRVMPGQWPAAWPPTWHQTPYVGQSYIGYSSSEMSPPLRTSCRDAFGSP